MAPQGLLTPQSTISEMRHFNFIINNINVFVANIRYKLKIPFIKSLSKQNLHQCQTEVVYKVTFHGLILHKQIFIRIYQVHRHIANLFADSYSKISETKIRDYSSAWQCSRSMNSNFYRRTCLSSRSPPSILLLPRQGLSRQSDVRLH